jgi:hypothetical protein
MNIAFIVFNRPDLTKRVFERIRAARPERLLIVADGPRDDAEADLCRDARCVATHVDWPCKLMTNMASSNMGCRARVSSGLTWVFEKVDACIILEDDCLPDPSFFSFAQAALERYRDEPNIGMISGNNHGNYQSDCESSCHFSAHAGIWGWATWADRWQLYDESMNAYADSLDQVISSSGQSGKFKKVWGRMIRAGYNRDVDTWDTGWSLALRANSLLTVRPKRNLVANIGQLTGTNCSGCVMPEAYRQASALEDCYSFPEVIRVDRWADRKYERSWAKEMSEPFDPRKWLRSVWWRTGSRLIHRCISR